MAYFVSNKHQNKPPPTQDAQALWQRGKVCALLIFFPVELTQAKESPFFPVHFSSRQLSPFFLFHFNYLKQKALRGTSDFKDTRSNVRQVIKTYTACVGQINIPSRATSSSVPAAL